VKSGREAVEIKNKHCRRNGSAYYPAERDAQP
jgi:hypothetical protein